jgi:hypothetical protein
MVPCVNVCNHCALTDDSLEHAHLQAGFVSDSAPFPSIASQYNGTQVLLRAVQEGAVGDHRCDTMHADPDVVVRPDMRQCCVTV